MTILVPDLIYAGDTVIFDVPSFTNSIGTVIDSGTYTLKWYARTNTASEGTTITGTTQGDGWRITVSAATTVNFDAGLWTWQAVATKTPTTLSTPQAAASSLSSRQRFTVARLVHLTIAAAPRLTLKRLMLQFALLPQAAWCRNTALAVGACVVTR